ncbi:unnamed protein product, partial [Durusdinium trenchii]
VFDVADPSGKLRAKASRESQMSGSVQREAANGSRHEATTSKKEKAWEGRKRETKGRRLAKRPHETSHGSLEEKI